jgi:signal transduction histidine kinase
MVWLRRIVFSMFLVYGGSLTAQKSPVDSLRQVLDAHTTQDTILTKHLYNLGWELNRGDVKEARPVLQRGLESARANGPQRFVPLFLNELGKGAVAGGEVELGLNFYFEALNLPGIEPMSQAFVHTNIANAYFNLKNYDTAMEYHNKALAIKREHGKPKDIAITLLNMGNAYRRSQNTGEAIRHLEEAEKTFLAIGDKKGVALAANNLGNVQADLGNREEALKKYQIANRMFKDMGNTEGASGTSLNIAGLQMELKQYAGAEQRLKEALEGARSINEHSIMLEANELFSQLYEQTGNSSAALKHLREFVALNDSLVEAKNRGNIEKLRIGFETEKKEQENTFLKTANAEQKLRLHIALVSAVLIGLLSLLLFAMYRRQRKTSMLLRSLNEQVLGMNAEITRQQEQLRHQNEELVALNQTKDRFFSIIAHDVRTPFFGLLGFTELLQKELPNLSVPEIADYTGRMLRSGRAINDLFENLLAWSRLELNEIQTEVAFFNVKETVSGIADIFELNAARKRLGITLNIPADLELHTDKQIFATIVRNLLSNAIKYSNTDASIVIAAEPENGGWRIAVKDQGIGIPEDLLEQLKLPEPQLSRPGTGNEKGTGLGLHVCKRLSERLGAALDIESEEGKGTTVSLLVAA